MSTDQVVSRYPQEWVDLVDDTIDDWFSAKALDVWPDFGPAALLVLAALEEVGALATEEARWGYRTALGAVYPCATEALARATKGPSSTGALLRRRSGPWVEVPDA